MKSICKTSEGPKGREETHQRMGFSRLHYGLIWHLGFIWEAIFGDEMTPQSYCFSHKTIFGQCFSELSHAHIEIYDVVCSQGEVVGSSELPIMFF